MNINSSYYEIFIGPSIGGQDTIFNEGNNPQHPLELIDSYFVDDDGSRMKKFGSGALFASAHIRKKL